MKHLINTIAAILLCLSLLAFTNEVLKKLALSETEAKAAIRNNFINNGLYFPDNKTIRSISINQRATTVRELGQYIRQYVESPEFNKAYQEARAAAKPATKGDVKTLIAERLVAIEEELKEAESMLKNAPANSRKLYELSIQQLKQEREALKNPAHPAHADYVENLTEETEEAANQSQMEADYFNKEYPATVKELVKLRLQQFLQVTATIDFNAKLIQQGRIKVFADPALEAKDGNWKRLFRAGPETIGAARQFAQQWLSELNK